MKNSIKYYKNTSTAALAFVILGYIVKFYPSYLTGFDTTIQTALRGDLPDSASQFWTSITVLGDVIPLFSLVFCPCCLLYVEKMEGRSLLFSR